MTDISTTSTLILNYFSKLTAINQSFYKIALDTSFDSVIIRA